MHRTTWPAVVGALAVALTGVAESADHVLAGAKLTLRRSASGKERLTFVARDPAFLFPALGSPDDPGTGTPGGATLELASTAEPGGTGFTAPPGVGNPGWKSKDATYDSHTYSNGNAAPGPTAVRAVSLKQGKRLKVTARDVGLALAGPQGTVGVRLTTGTLRNCALFDAPTIRRDEAGRFVAAESVATALPDCSSLLPAPPTTSSTSSTTTTTSTTLFFLDCFGISEPGSCNGFCEPGVSCLMNLYFFSTPSPFWCSCYPDTVTPCGLSTYPTCGGVCSSGGVCQPIRNPETAYMVCGCVDPSVECGSPGGPGSCSFGTCPPGSACTYVSQPAVQCGCGPQ